MLTILLPAYNEEAALPKLIPALAGALGAMAYRILVVDDGSTDRTVAVATSFSSNMQIVVESHGVNKGLGQAMATGFAWCVTHQVQADDVVVALDADNTHPPMLIPEMCLRIRNDQADVVIASRYAPGGEEVGLSTFRRITSRGASWLLRLFFPIPGARDYTCGFRAYGISMLGKAMDHYGPDFVSERGFACMAEILIRLSFLGAGVTEVPLVLRYDLKEGASKMKVIKTIGQYLGLIRKLRRVRGQLNRNH